MKRRRKMSLTNSNHTITLVVVEFCYKVTSSVGIIRELRLFFLFLQIKH